MNFITFLRRLKDKMFANMGQCHPAKLVALGYLSYILIGWLLLALPFMNNSGVTALDNLFIATSAVSTTGLVTVDIAKSYTFLGQLVILLLIQIGGVGYMTFGSFVILSRSPEITKRRAEISETVFSLPESFRIDKFLRSVVRFTIVIEFLGAVALYFAFTSAGVPDAAWQAVFHSVSAFCTAGFSLFSTSFESFSANFWLNIIIAVLSYLGAIGFIVCVDYWRKIRGKVKQVTLTSKIILWVTFWITLVGAALIFMGEPSINQHRTEDRILESLFQAMTAITTVGFNTVSIGALSNASLLIIIMMMVVGASPSGTGGGLKSTTFSALLGVMKSALKGRHEVTFWGKLVPSRRVWSAMASLSFYSSALLIGAYLLELTQQTSFAANVFEAASALGTVGLSTGITASLTDLGKCILILLMYCGRLGPVTFGMALFHKPPNYQVSSDSDLVA
ncbi:MAG: potassium transporter TrkG [Candidatus Zixiibacteriota bacterium]